MSYFIPKLALEIRDISLAASATFVAQTTTRDDKFLHMMGLAGAIYEFQRPTARQPKKGSLPFLDLLSSVISNFCATKQVPRHSTFSFFLEAWRGAEISFFPQPLLKLLKVGLQSLQMGSVAPMKSPYVT